MSWLLFGVYEIGYTIEDPFQGTLRLSILCDGIRRDVLGDDLHRDTAFQLNEQENGKIASNEKDLGVTVHDDFQENEVADEDTSAVIIDDTSHSAIKTSLTLDGTITEIIIGQHAFE